MNQQVASGAPVFPVLGGEKRELSRLSRKDIAVLMGKMPVSDEDDRMYLTVYDVNRWAATPVGAREVLCLACGVDAETLEHWDESEVRLSAIASWVVAESITTGERVEVSEGEQRPDPPVSSVPSGPETSPTKP